MFSLLKHVYNLFDYDYQKEQYSKKFEKENQQFDDELEKENPPKEEVFDETTKLEDEGSCSRQTGVITSIRSTNGTIDNTLFFDASAAPLFHELKAGCTVEYLSFQSSHSDYVKVVKVDMVQDNSWDATPTEEQIQKTIQTLKSQDHRYFNTHQRSILGLIIHRNRQFLTVDTDYKEIIVDLDAVSIEFIPKEGDRICLNCKVQTDENFVDLAGEILEVISVHATRTKTEQGIVKKIHDDWGVIDSDCYFTMDSLESEVKLNEGDVISAMMIECERGNFSWRCLTIEVLERSVIIPEKIAKPIKTINQAVSISDGIQFTFQNAFEVQEQDIEIKNNSERVQTMLRVDLAGSRRDLQLKLGKMELPLILQPGQSKIITVKCESRFFGHFKEKLYFSFIHFKTHRFINVAVGIDENMENTEIKSGFKANRSRYYAEQVWSKKNEIIPGVRSNTIRRFVANRIGSYDVPQKLRSVLLTDLSRAEQITNIEMTYPHLAKELTIHNYANRFETLLYIEEIENFVNFRQFDLERGHFTREGEFLALTIDNLAERRPSLMLGDTVRATNPWAEEDDNRAYEGCIHKVLFNRIFVKFNPAFQNKYNGEDYRLEFFFSRFGFRKQHYAIQKIVRDRGEHFLFPSKIVLNKKLQLDVSLDEDSNLLIADNILPKQWYNPNLNIIQKNAVKNVLRGEAKSMPYVIFGPPGTGKTLTLVEIILQLVTSMPNSRILVGTPSNSSADLISSRIIDSGVLNPGDFVRLVAQRLVDKDLIPDYLKQYCATVDIATEGTAKDSMIVTESGMKLQCQIKYMGRHKITISTCSTLGNFLLMGFPREHFTHLIIDESGQCTEPEVAVPMCLLSPNSGQTILAGDPCQLGPIVINNFAGDRGLNTSFLERLTTRFPYRKDKIRFPQTGFDPRLVTKLLNNYRALPSILHTYSSLFYDSELVPMLSAKGNKEFELLQNIKSLLPASEKRSESHATFFHGIRGVNKQDADSPSWYNPIEAKQVFLMTIQLYRLKISPNQIGIITPYQKQVKILRTLFAEADVAMPKIGTVEEFQGQERDVILISTVRSSTEYMKADLKYSLGFACSAKRMNVAISRARALLYICGNPLLLSTNEKWGELISYCVENDSYVGCELPEAFADK